MLITACSNSYLLPPAILFKVSKPRSKTFKDIPPQEIPDFQDKALMKMMERGEFLGYNTYTSWNNKPRMRKDFVSSYSQHFVSDSLLLLDNHGGNTTDTVTQQFENNNV